MSKIEKLTPEQEARFPEFVEKWTKIGLSTEPANRELAEQGIVEAYRQAGLEAPKIVWCSSPLSMGITRALTLEILKKDSVGDSVRASVRASVWDSVLASVRASVGDSVWASVLASVRASVLASVWASVGDSVWASVLASVLASVWDSVGDSVRASVVDSVRASVVDSVVDSGYGQHDANWLAFYDFFKEACGLEQQTNKLSGLWKVSQNAGWFLPHRNICWISERHTTVKQESFDEGRRWRLHCDDGPAVQYPDGWSIYAIHGVRVSQQVVEAPETLTIKQIEDEPNAEIRRVVIDRFGQDKFLMESGAELILTDLYGALYRKELKNDPEPLVMVKVRNSTPEPDGSIKDYFLRVPPTVKTPHEAVAWTFGLTPEQYIPGVQT